MGSPLLLGDLLEGRNKGGRGGLEWVGLNSKPMLKIQEEKGGEESFAFVLWGEKRPQWETRVMGRCEEKDNLSEKKATTENLKGKTGGEKKTQKTVGKIPNTA